METDMIIVDKTEILESENFSGTGLETRPCGSQNVNPKSESEYTTLFDYRNFLHFQQFTAKFVVVRSLRLSIMVN